MTPRKQLEHQIADILEGSLGLAIFPSWRDIFPKWIFPRWLGTKSNTRPPSKFRLVLERNPFAAGLAVSAIYAFLFCALPWLLFHAWPFYFQKPSPQLISLQIYGAFWCGWVTTTTNIASASILNTIKDLVTPALPEVVVETVRAKLKNRYQEKKRVLRNSWALGAFFAALAGFFVYHDAEKACLPLPSILTLLFWCAGWAILFTAEAKVINVSQFYRYFASCLEDDPNALFAMDPARSTLVSGIAQLSQTMLWFWCGIAVSIAVVIPFAVEPWHGDAFWTSYSKNWFVFWFIVFAGTASTGWGAIIVLQCEAALRRAVGKVTHSTLRAIKAAVANLPGVLMDTGDMTRLSALNALHKEVAAAGSYRSAIASAFSVIVPFIVPVTSLIKYFWK